MKTKQRVTYFHKHFKIDHYWSKYLELIKLSTDEEEHIHHASLFERIEHYLEHQIHIIADP